MAYMAYEKIDYSLGNKGGVDFRMDDWRGIRRRGGIIADKSKKREQNNKKND